MCDIVAIDLKTGTHAWMKPMGDGPKNHPKLRDLNLPPLGNRAGWVFPLATKTLLIVGHNDKIIARDKATGKLIGEVRLRNARGEGLGTVTGAPMTYMHEGKQYIAMALSERPGNRTQQIVALALP